MSNIIPPLLSSTPPPIVDNFDEDEDDEFGDYRTAGDTSFACDTPSIPPTPEFSPKKNLPALDINSNNSKDSSKFDGIIIVENTDSTGDLKIESKDFHDRRKSSGCSHESTELSFSSTEDSLSKTSNIFEQVDRKINSDDVPCDSKPEKVNYKIDEVDKESKIIEVLAESTVNGCEIDLELSASFATSFEQMLSNDTSALQTFENNSGLEFEFTEFSSSLYESPSQDGSLSDKKYSDEEKLSLPKINGDSVIEDSRKSSFDGSKSLKLGNDPRDLTFPSSEPTVFEAISENQISDQSSKNTLPPSSLFDYYMTSSQNLEAENEFQTSSSIQENLERKPISDFETPKENIEQENDEFDDFVACTEQNWQASTQNFDLSILKQTCISSQSEEDYNHELEIHIDSQDDDFDDFVTCSDPPIDTDLSIFPITVAKDIELFSETEETQRSAIATSEIEKMNKEKQDNFNELIYNKSVAYPDFSNIKLSLNNLKESDIKEKNEKADISRFQDIFEEVPEEDDDEFGDFEACANPSVQTNMFSSTLSTAPKDEVDEFENFADFTSAPLDQTEDSSDFGNFASQVAGSSETPEDEDDEHIMLDINADDVLNKAEKIVKIMFDLVSSPSEELCKNDMTEKNFVFNALKDITETKALSYHWAKSSSQKSLLKALNVDESDILYGPTLSLSLPRFAANLSIAPLEPIKSDTASTSNIQDTSLSSPNPSNTADVPTAQFDWSSSGLTNPLDYSQTMLLDLEHLVQTLDISGSLCTANSNKPASPIDELEEWDLWLKSKAAKEKVQNSSQNQKTSLHKQTQATDCLTPSVASLVLQPEVVGFSSIKNDIIWPTSNITTESHNTIVSDNFGFTNLHSSQQNWSSVVPLRETHISEGDKNQPGSDLVGWLQPTIVTPVMTRRDVSETLQDDDFDDFQMVLPDKGLTNVGEVNRDFELPLNTDKSKNDPVFGEFKSSKPEKEEKVTTKISDFSDDEFTDFHSSVPEATEVKINSETPIQNQLLQPPKQTVSKVTEPVTTQIFPQPLQPVPLEPLKPINMQPASPAKPAQINWPNPGITDEDLHNIDLTYSVKPSKTIENDDQQEAASPAKENEIKKDHSLDDDDWSDFVSVQEPISKQLASQTSKTERTSTPDLPLSVLNLSHVQPVKQPIPVITPKGLIQTQLPTSAVPLKVVQTSIYNNHVNNMLPINVQPSLITNQYIGQVYQNTCAGFSPGGEYFAKHLPNTSLPVNMQNKSQYLPNSTKHNADEDDYWSDFVSSKPAGHLTHSVQQQKVAPTTSKSFQHLNGLFQNNTPNIITNPGHFDAFQSFVPPNNVAKPNRVANMHSRKSALSTASAVPELDFVAPKSRTTHRK